jgi:hypothetical protein
MLVSCSKEIEVEQVAYESKIVVDGWIENNDFANVLLTRSSPFLTEYDSASIRNTFLNYAKVTLTTGSGDSEVLTLMRQDEFFPPFIYQSTRIKGEVGQTYSLEILFDNKKVTAETSIPSMAEVSEVVAEQVSDTTIVINATIMDVEKGEKNYYYSQIKTRHFDTRFHPTRNPVLNDYLFDGEEAVWQMKRSNQPDPLGIYDIDHERKIPRNEFAINDSVFVKISAIDAASYEVLNAIYQDRLNLGNPFAFVDKGTVTNVKGGIGRWTGMASYLRFVYFDQ